MSGTGTSIEDRYAEVAQRGMDAIASGRGNRDVAPRDGDPRWGISAIFRLAGPPAERISDFAEEARPSLGAHHIFYGSHDLHTTLRSFEGYRAGAGPGDERVEKYVEIVEELTRGLDPIPIEYRGVVASPAGLLIAGWPGDPGGLQHLRDRIHGSLDELGEMTGPEKDAPRQLFHASLCVFMGGIADPAATTALLADHADRGFGTVTFDAIEIVRYRRSEEAVEILPLHRCALGEA